jgi:serine/threonine-protein kinase RsbW
MKIKFSLSLPRDEVSIPVVRNICSRSLGVLGVQRECLDDVRLALTEACANVLLHAHADDEYEVSVGIDEWTAVIDVTDRGGGFEESVGERETHPFTAGDGPDGLDRVAERGRGILLMRALMDHVHFHAVDGPPGGTRVHLEKRLRWEAEAPGAQLRRPPDQGTWPDGDRGVSAHPDGPTRPWAWR